jgi:ferredoxin
MKDETGSDPRRELWEFHLTGPGDAEASVDLRPAAIGPTLEPGRAARDYPLIVSAGDGSPPAPLLRRLVDGPDAIDGGRALLEQAEAFARAALEAVERDGGSTPPVELIDRLLPEFESLEAQLIRLRDELPQGTTLLGLGPRTPLLLYVDALRRERTAKQAAFGEECRSLAGRLSELLPDGGVASPDSVSAATLASRLGAGAERFIDADALAADLSGRRGTARLSPACRAAVLDAARSLAEHAERRQEIPQLIVVAQDEPTLPETVERVQIVKDDDPCTAALRLFDEQAARHVPVLRAARLARLALAGAFDADQLARLERFDWQAASAEELALLPALLVLEDEARLDGASLAPFSRLLRAGRPLHLLVEGAPLGAQPLGEHRVRPVSLALAHRDALVVQSSLTETEHLVESLDQLVGSMRTAVLFLPRADPAGAGAAWTRLVAALASRATPCLRRNPDRTEADRLDLEANPQRERAWPIQQVRDHDIEESFTFAHAAALEPAYRSHLRPIPPEAWSDEQCDVRSWVEASAAERLRRLPFVWVTNGDGQLGRALITRELAFACDEGRRSWLELQEREETPEPAEVEPAPAPVKPVAAVPPSPQLQADAVAQLVRGLLGEPAVLPATAEPTPETAAAAPVETPAAEAAVPERPYIESQLCTSCNDCTKINARMFQYDENKQAFIADARAGTFAQLVKAAEKCPARCIHPGTPRADDSTATDKMIARAAKFL